MLENNLIIRKRKTVFTRVVALLLPIVCIVLLLTQTAFAKNTYLIKDGEQITIHTTYATDPADVLDEAGLELGTDDTYTTQLGLGMSEITIQRMQVVDIVYGGNTLSVSTYGETVESLLNRLNFKLTADRSRSTPPTLQIRQMFWTKLVWNWAQMIPTRRSLVWECLKSRFSVCSR